MIGKIDTDVNRITMVNCKGFYTSIGYYTHDDSSLYDIIFRCKDIIRGCETVLPELHKLTTTAHGILSDKSPMNYAAYCEGIDTAYKLILKYRDHAEKILKQAETAERCRQ